MAPFSQGEGLTEKIIYPVVPPHTEYWLTKRGLKLRGVVAAMARFAYWPFRITRVCPVDYAAVPAIWFFTRCNSVSPRVSAPSTPVQLR